MVKIYKVASAGDLVDVENSEKVSKKKTLKLDFRTDFFFNSKSGKVQVIHEQENVELFDDDAQNCDLRKDDYIMAEVRHDVNADGYQHNYLRRYTKLNLAETF